MKKYFAFFRLRFINGLQYRAAAYAGVATQFAWGAMEIIIFVAFYQENKDAFPMDMSALASYIWLQQAFLALFMIWFFESDILQAISSGNIAYELCRPIDLYHMWFVRGIATRLAKAGLRFLPIVLVAGLLPYPYGLSLPSSWAVAGLSAVSMVLALLNVTAFSMLIYIVTFYTISSQGIRTILFSLAEMFSGAIIPIPFFPDKIRWIVELLPFASMQNIPLRIYGGDISGNAAIRSIALQIFWLLVLWGIGKICMYRAIRRVVIQGG